MLDINKYQILGVPISCGSPTRGSEKASEYFYNYFLSNNVSCLYKKIKAKNKLSFKDKKLYSKKSVKATSKKLYKEINKIYKKELIPFIIGGDHSLSIGSVAASINKYKDDVLVVWVDAHTDINTEESSISHYIHGMPNAISMGLTCKELSPIKQKEILKGNNLVILGARSIDDGEYSILKNNNVKYISVNEMRKIGISNYLEMIRENNKAKYVHLSFDVDCLDPSEFISTGYNIEKGFSVSEVKQILSFFSENYILELFECVEYNPNLDSENKDLNKIIDCISSVIGGIR